MQQLVLPIDELLALDLEAKLNSQWRWWQKDDSPPYCSTHIYDTTDMYVSYYGLDVFLALRTGTRWLQLPLPLPSPAYAIFSPDLTDEFVNTRLAELRHELGLPQSPVGCSDETSKGFVTKGSGSAG